MRSLCSCWMLLSEQQKGPGRWVGQDLADTPQQLLGLGLAVGSSVCLSSWTLPNLLHLRLLTEIVYCKADL